MVTEKSRAVHKTFQDTEEAEMATKNFDMVRLKVSVSTVYDIQ